MKPERMMAAAAVLMASGIGIGALGSHALRAVLSPRQLESLATAVNYQLLNSLGLLVVGVIMKNTSPGALRWVAWFLIAGIICFSGGIYLMLAEAPDFLGLITPAGGVLLIAAWSMLAWKMFKESLMKSL